MSIIIAVEDFILLYVFFALVNCSVGAYHQHKGSIEDTDYEDTSYFTWFALWFILLPREIYRWVKNLF